MKMAIRLKIDKKYYLLDNELSNPSLNAENDPNTVRIRLFYLFF